MKTLLKTIERYTKVPILKTVAVIDGVATSTDLDIYTSMPCALPNGIYNAESIKSGLNILDKERTINDFPNKPKLKPFAQITFNAASVKTRFAWVALAMSTEETRYYLNGICFHSCGDVVATDDHRLHMFSNVEGIPEYKAFPRGVIMPAKTVKLAIEAMSESKAENMVIGFTHEGFIITCGNIVIQSRYIDGTYPEYKWVIPNHENKTVFDNTELKPYVKDIKALAKIAESKRIIIAFSHGKAIAEYIDLPKIEFSVSTKFGNEKIGFNLPYLMSLNSGQCFYGKAKDPIKVISNDMTSVLMPVKL